MSETAIERIEREMREQFPSETSRLDRAVEAFEEGKARLFDQQGRQIYSDEQHQERLASLLGKLDTSLATISEASEAAITKARTDLVKLEGADPYDKLSAEQQAKAATRQPFIREDVATLPPPEVARRARASIATGDKATAYLWHRYIGQRLSPADADGMPRARSGGNDIELMTVLRELGALFGDEARAEKRRAIEQRISSAQVLEGRVRQARSTADGSQAAAAERQYVLSRF
jgi:hypothetical protein